MINILNKLLGKAELAPKTNGVVESKLQEDIMGKARAIILFAENNKEKLLEKDNAICFDSIKNSDVSIKIIKGINPKWKINIEIHIMISNLKLELTTEEFSPINIILYNYDEFSESKSKMYNGFRGIVIRKEHFEDRQIKKHIELAINMAEYELVCLASRLKEIDGLEQKELLDLPHVDFEVVQKFSQEKEKSFIKKEIPDILIKSNLRKNIEEKLITKNKETVMKI